MEMAAQFFIILLISGLVMVGAEVFVPGGFLGILGGVALLGAVIAGFIAFPAYGVYIAVGIVFLVAGMIVLWARFFPRTRVGRSMTVTKDLASSKGTEDDLESLAGKEGVAESDLRPAGFAMIEGRRVDVVTQGGMISRGQRVRVIDIESNRVVVRLTERKEP